MVATEPSRALSRAVRLTIRVAPGARRSEVVGRLGEAWKVRVRAAPERGRANDEVVTLLSHALGVPTASVRIVAGHGARTKVVEVEGLEAEDVERRLRPAGGSSA